MKILAPAFFAREDTVAPVRIGLVALAVNFVLSVLLAWYLTRIGYEATHAGLALATSVAALLNAVLLYRGLRRDGVVVHTPGWMTFGLRILIANGVMWGILAAVAKPLDWWLAASLGARVAELSVNVIAGVVVYFGALLLVGLRPSQLGMKPH